MNDIRLKVAGGIFLVIAILQLTRFLMHWQVTAAGKVIPVGLSGVAAVVFAVLAVWMLKPKNSK